MINRNLSVVPLPSVKFSFVCGDVLNVHISSARRSACAYILTISHVLRVEPVEEGVGLSPLTADHHVLPGLVPEVVAKGGGVTFLLPRPLDLKGLPIQQDESTYRKRSHGIRTSSSVA